MDSQVFFQVDNASLEDIPRLAEIHVDSCATDPAIGLYFRTREEFTGLVIAMLQGQIGKPEWTHLKAVDKVSGKIVGWSSWVQTNYSTSGTGAPKAANATNEQVQVNREGRVEFKFQPGLGTYAKQETERFFRAWAGDRTHLYLLALFVDSSFQRRGIASALVQACCKSADEARLPAVLQASPSGYPVYASRGFKVIGQLDVDLREWAPNAKGDDKGYGRYVYRFMLRESS